MPSSTENDFRPLPENRFGNMRITQTPKKKEVFFFFFVPPAKLGDGFFVSRVPLLPPSPPSAAASGHSTLIGPRLPYLQNGGGGREEGGGGERLSPPLSFPASIGEPCQRRRSLCLPPLLLLRERNVINYKGKMKKRPKWKELFHCQLLAGRDLTWGA